MASAASKSNAEAFVPHVQALMTVFGMRSSTVFPVMH